MCSSFPASSAEWLSCGGLLPEISSDSVVGVGGPEKTLLCCILTCSEINIVYIFPLQTLTVATLWEWNRER